MATPHKRLTTLLAATRRRPKGLRLSVRHAALLAAYWVTPNLATRALIGALTGATTTIQMLVGRP